MNASELTVSQAPISPPSGQICATLPIEDPESLRLQAGRASELGKRFSAQYAAATPYPHIVLDDFLPSAIAEGMLAAFPARKIAGDVVYQDKTFEYNKRQIQPDECDTFVRRFFGLFNSAPVLDFLSALTGISGLLPDPYFEGGGFHEILNGGRLGLHADFRINARLKLQRRLNLLIYLNKGWQDAYGGHFEMWDKRVKQRAHRIAPLFNRCVIFNTDRDSWHGHPEPLNTPAHVTRKSIALYYYSASQKIYEEVPRHGTVFVKRPTDVFSPRIVLKYLQAYVTASELLPPILYRGLKSLRTRSKALPP